MCTSGRKKTEQDNKIKTTIKHRRKKKKAIRAKKEEKEKNSKKLKRIALWCRKAPENLSSESLQQKIEEK